ncbi:cupin domain-containing protein [Draconibacterium halophilum]|uniref:hypothetical protein n=1 Tax=Draconibacterium halophilum TaxID=2706887 RepID=UPI00193FC512|nr:hypothetical protein [Draconibacterium halophilum]
MKRIKIIVSFIALIFVSSTAISQNGKVVLNTNDVPEDTHVHLDDFPKDMVIPMIHGWGGMTVDINNTPKGTNFSPLLEGLENDLCQVPHWGYVIEGAIEIEYDDGNKETFKKGEAFYMKPGHTGIVLEDLLLVSFSPEEGMHHLGEHLEKKMKEMQEAQSSND